MTMTNGRPQSRIIIVVLLLTCLAATFAITACSSNKSQAKALIAEYMTGQGATDISIDIFHTSRNYPDKAYTSATITYNFASSDGKPQREFLGFTLNRAGNGWRIEKNTSYTTEEDQAEKYIAVKDGK
jgi:flagellar basal body-associated protein FliL